jgi:hypothetical protein
MIFRGANPASGAILDYWVGEGGGDVSLTVLDGGGEVVARVPTRARPGLNRSVWNLRHTDPDQDGSQSPQGPLVIPGTYTVRLEVGEATSDTPLEVREDPRIQVDPDVRREWTEDLLALGELARAVDEGARGMTDLAEAMEAEPPVSEALAEEARELQRQWNELRSRTRGLLREVEGWVGPLTLDQESRRSYYQEMAGTLRRETQALSGRIGGGGS